MIGTLILVAVVAVVLGVAVAMPTLDSSAAVPLDVAVRTARTGDLVLFRSNAIRNVLVRLYTPFTHVGMVVVDARGAKKILETHRRGDVVDPHDDGGGVRMYDLVERVSKYDGAVFHARLKRPLTDCRRLAMLDLAYRYRNVPYHEAYVRHYVSHCMLGVGPGKTDATMFCSEFIGLLFGIDRERAQCMTPADVATMGHHERPERIVLL